MVICLVLIACGGDDGGGTALSTDDYTVTTSGPDDVEDFASLGTCTPDEMGGSLSLAGKIRNESPAPHGYEITVTFDDGRTSFDETVFVPELQPGESGDWYAIGSGLQEGTCEVSGVEAG